MSPLAARPPEGLYLHVPFCISICPYCDFVVLAGAVAQGPRNRVGDLLDGLVDELRLRAELLRSRPEGAGMAPLGSLYLGGGTPSLLAPAQVQRLLAEADAAFGLAPQAEVTLEANPGPLDIGDLAGFRAAGVNRLSVGAQSLDGAELKRLGRRHGPEDVAAAVHAARAAGFGSLSLDLLTDIPGQTPASWRDSLGRALDLEPDHLSVYTLTLDDPDAAGLTGPLGDHLPLRRGARAWRVRAAQDRSEDLAADMELITDELAEAAGLRRYEIANLARPGFESRHNLLYWRRRACLGIGPGAHGFDGGLVRSWNAARLDGYLSAVAAGRLPPGGSETIDEPTARAESAILGLRLVEGIASAEAAHPDVAETLDWAREHGLAEDVGDRTRLSQQGRLLADEVFVRLLPGPVAGPLERAPARSAAAT